MQRLLLMMLPFLLSNITAVGQADKTKTTNSDPDTAKIVTSDINLFWRAYDKAKPDNDLIVYRDQYLKAGSIGLQAFTRARIFSSCELVDAIEKHRRYYSSLRQSSLKVQSYESRIRSAFHKLKELYPSAVFPNVYINRSIRRATSLC